ncbi:hypothetical protein [Actinoplanes sp. NBRC 101535]|uniref:hypothetical protein n=1 Tax=Actinoplanes sp. NBRC 101535 TaxID=3032196 RepID=UPI0024A27BCE|nr:hypothetical protein [Actinoplanes sp. NBRC 101535]GLY08279.1 hypothetical protein Acsp01_86580 [Actinoplanes sp. NBRC 101535]
MQPQDDDALTACAFSVYTSRMGGEPLVVEIYDGDGPPRRSTVVPAGETRWRATGTPGQMFAGPAHDIPQPIPGSRAVDACPVTGCPWEYELASPQFEDRDGRTVVVVPPPACADPATRAAGVLAAQQVLTGPAAANFEAVSRQIMEATNAQHDAVLRAHLLAHPHRNLQATFGDRLDAVLQVLNPPA